VSRKRSSDLARPRIERNEMPTAMAKIIVVEDDASMCRALERILRVGGYEVVTFASAEAALAADASAMADCLVLDIHLPGISGFVLYRRLALSGKEMPVIFITAHDEPAVREEAERLAAKSYLPKPFSGRAVLDAVAQALCSH
jgi:FixJ family two-component response regulator